MCPGNLSPTSDQNIMWSSLPFIYYRPELLALSNDKIIYPIQDPGSRKHKIPTLFFLRYIYMWKSMISINSFSRQTQFNFFMTVPMEQYLATPLFLFELSRDSLKNFGSCSVSFLVNLYSLCFGSKHLTHQIYHL